MMMCEDVMCSFMHYVLVLELYDTKQQKKTRWFLYSYPTFVYGYVV